MKSSKIQLFLLVLDLVAGCTSGSGSGTPSATLRSIAITPAGSSIALWTTEQFTATGTFSDNSDRDITASVSWISSAANVATIGNAANFNGLAASVSTGTTTITAELGGISDSTALTVGATALVSIDVQPTVSSIPTGTTEKFTATGTYSDNSARDITTLVSWASSDPNVATVSSNVATAISTATTAATMITARSGNASGSALLTVTGGNAAPASNVLPITVNGSLCSASTSASYINKPCVSVTVCTHGTSTCQTIDDILLDTGSYGLRIFRSALGPVTLSQLQATGGSGSVVECTQFGDGSSDWGPVQLGDVTLGGETAQNVPIQVIDSSFGTVPSSCGIPDTSPSVAGLTGILGVGVFTEDCGSTCATDANNGIYYSCSGSTCTGTTVPLSSQVQNPVALLPADNNGVSVQLTSVPSNGSPSVNGILVLGIGTKTNNVPSGITTYNTDANGEIVTNFSGSYAGVIDSGSNGLFFAPPSTGLLPDCPSSDSGWFCPSSTTTLSAVNEGASGSPSGEVLFQIENFTSLTNSSNNAFSNIGGSSSPNQFDWGIPLFFGRNIFVGIEGKTSSVGTGPYYSY